MKEELRKVVLEILTEHLMLNKDELVKWPAIVFDRIDRVVRSFNLFIKEI